MRAVVLRSHGEPEVLGIETVPDPVPGAEEVVVDVAAAALNRADLLQRRGLYPGPKMAVEIPGLEFSGTVSAVGERIVDARIGDRVMGIVGGGAYAEKVALHERLLIPVPDAIDLVDAAAVPEVFITAWDAMVLQGGFTSGRTALVNAGASGIGTAAIQIVKALGGTVIVTASAGKLSACRELGADHAIERTPHDWLSDVRAITGGRGVDVVLDSLAGDELDRNIDALALQGRIVVIGVMAGAAATVTVAKLLGKRAGITGTTLRMRPLEEKIAVARRFTREILPFFASGHLRPVVDSRFPFDAVADAHRHMEANANVGKILLRL